VLGRQVSSPTVVDPDQIVPAAVRIRHHAAIQQDDRNVRFLKTRHNREIGLARLRAQFDRREEYAG
jgi:hypothetical protein